MELQTSEYVHESDVINAAADGDDSQYYIDFCDRAR